MLKKITLAAVVSVFLSAVSLTAQAQVSVGGNVRAWLQQGSEKVGDGDALGSMHIHSAAALGFSASTPLTNLDGWSASAGFAIEFPEGRPSSGQVTAGRTPFGVGADGNWYVGLDNDTIGIKAGDTRYLDSVGIVDAEKALWLDASAIDNGDTSTRGNNLGFTLKGLPVALKFGVAMGSKDKLVDVIVKDATDATTAKASKASKASDSYNEVGFFVGFDGVAGLKTGLQYNSQETKESGDSTTATNTKIDVAYDLSGVANVPVQLALSYWMHTEKSDIGKTGNGHTTTSLAAKYSFANGNAGFHYDTVAYDKFYVGVGEDTEDASIKERKRDTGRTATGMGFWFNYDLGEKTLLHASYSSTEDKSGMDTDDDPDVKTTKIRISAGLKQSF